MEYHTAVLAAAQVRRPAESKFAKNENKACIVQTNMLIYLSRMTTVVRHYPGVAKFGIALDWGSRGR
ncbi:MAG: hypothetical protein RSC08_01605, partial [Oscillospiraceae bacterium]